MKTLSLLGSGILLSMLALAPAVSHAAPRTAQQDSGAKQDIKDAGHATKRAAQKTGSATKKVTKKAVNKSAKKTREGADKVEEKTQP